MSVTSYNEQLVPVWYTPLDKPVSWPVELIKSSQTSHSESIFEVQSDFRDIAHGRRPSKKMAQSISRGYKND